LAETPAWKIERIRKDHARESFDCGIEELNTFLRRYARQNEEHGLSRTFVAVRGGSPRVLGYHTLRSGQVEIRNLSPDEVRRFPRYPVPVVHLARLAVDREVHGQGLGELLLLDALARAHEAAKVIAAYAVEVEAVNDAARRFYVKYGFQELLDDRLHLYLPVKVISSLFKS
jgi:ribosomal protein S18 acetylase RimI-like enzyme